MWHDIIENNYFIKSLYEKVPDLKGISLISCVLSFSHRSVQVRAFLPHFPDRPPKKWHPECDCVSMELEFWDVERVNMVGFDHKVYCDILMTKKADGVFEVEIASPSFLAKISCGYIKIGNIEASKFVQDS